MQPSDLITIDFETEAIVGNPLLNPPSPHTGSGGVSIKDGEQPSVYYTGQEMLEQMKKAYASGRPLLFMNAPFDLMVAEKHLGLEMPEWERIHDVQYLVFLKNPHAASLALKPSAETYLGLPPEEQDELHDWIVANIPEAKKSNAGAFITQAPLPLVEKYARKDTDITYELFKHLYPDLPVEPYDRERELMPILVRATQHGVRVNTAALNATLDQCRAAQERCENLIIGKLGGSQFNVHSGAELARALDAAGAVSNWVLTPTGKKSTAKDNLLKSIDDPELAQLLMYTSAMQTCIGTFIEPWLEKSAADGRLHPNWNQVRQPKGSGAKGTRTGRMSSDDPNFQNVPNAFDFDIHKDLVAMPRMKDFVLPEEGHTWLKRDFSGQEMRILAHFEEGELMKAYIDNPDLDPHGMVQGMIKDMIGKEFPRKFVKETGFGMIYGMGAPGLAKKIGCDAATARDLQSSYKVALPGVGKLQGITKNRGKTGRPIRTWGGREYYAEEPKIIGGRYRSFEYKLTNYLIQGSAADQSKQALIDWHNGKGDNHIFMTIVHDEINISAPIDEAPEAMEWLRQSMDKERFDVPFRSDSFRGETWGSIEEYEYE